MSYVFTESKYPSHKQCTCPLKCYRGPDKLDIKTEPDPENPKLTRTVSALCKEPWAECQSPNRREPSQLLLDVDTE